MKKLSLGIAGLDTSHVSSFAEVFNQPGTAFSLADDARIVRAFPGGSRSFSLSRDRVGGFTRDLAARGVEIVETLEELSGMDAYLLESVDGTQHLAQFELLSRFGKPIFIDKPLACGYADAKQIFTLAQSLGVPLMTTSCMRYTPGVADALPDGETVRVAECFGPFAILPDYRDCFWYGIHGAEAIYRYLGRGCESVRAWKTGDNIQLIGEWKDGRLGMVSGYQPAPWTFGIRLVTSQANRISLQNPDIPYLWEMTKAILQFFRTGISPIDPAESLEVIAFLEAASRSLASGGEKVRLSALD